MPQYNYTAAGPDGDPVQGSIEAHSLQHAREELKKQRIDPTGIYETLSVPVPGWSEQDALASTEDVQQTNDPVSTTPKEQTAYYPFSDTLRLYAGWLLSWYAIIYAIGSYQHMKELPFRIPYVESLFLSPLVLSFTLGAFLFLLITSLHRLWGGGFLKGIALTVFGVCAFVLYRMNIG